MLNAHSNSRMVPEFACVFDIYWFKMTHDDPSMITHITLAARPRSCEA